MTRFQLFAISLCCIAPASAHGITSYHVGNSLTVDGRVQGQLSQVADKGGHNLDIGGYHIECGQDLEYIVNHPDERCVGPTDAGLWDQALSGQEWDAVTMQYQPGGSTLDGETSAANTLIDEALKNPANTSTQFYIYSAWPKQVDGKTYADLWERSIGEAENPSTIHSREFARTFVQSVRKSQSDSVKSVRMIPVGEVLYELGQAFADDDIEGVTSVDYLHRDKYHLNNVGRYVASLTTYATLFADNPEGDEVPDWFLDSTRHGGAALEPEMVDLIQQTTWDVVSSHSFTGVPEPSTLGLLGSAMVLLLGHRRGCRRR